MARRAASTHGLDAEYDWAAGKLPHSAVEHVCRLARLLRAQWELGHVLVVGEAGSGRHALLALACATLGVSMKVLQRLRIVTAGVSGGRSLTGQFHDARRFPSTRWYPVPVAPVRRWGLGFVRRSRAIFCRAVCPNLNVTRRNCFCIAVGAVGPRRAAARHCCAERHAGRRTARRRTADGGGDAGGAAVRGEQPHQGGHLAAGAVRGSGGAHGLGRVRGGAAPAAGRQRPAWLGMLPSLLTGDSSFSRGGILSRLHHTH
jgi:hypothetical protein